ncbi:Lon protease family protein [Gallibacterium sp. AGMB14963]|uniref:Lon protease family protein n=1 Tax=Gallibacterium faecale TaxID=3019086 RepID=UPI0022F1A56D|nr:Lon protease family protein [Gallibacterium sp. AGMB14963]MDA3977878.1 Lon protease family protein [Gallibacterium sp. AGMB14963]
MDLLKLDWQSLAPTFAIQAEQINHTIDFWDLQPRATAAIKHWLAQDRHLLVLKGEEQFSDLQRLERYLLQHYFADQPLAINGVHYQFQQHNNEFPIMEMRTATSVQDNFIQRDWVKSADYLDPQHLFGQVLQLTNSDKLHLVPGLVHQLNGGILIVSIAQLLAQFDVWLRLLSLLQQQQFHWHLDNILQRQPCVIPSMPLKLKLILVGSRENIAELEAIQPDLYQLADYAELAAYSEVASEQQQAQWAGYIQHLAKSELQRDIDLSGINRLYQWLVRDSEDRQLISNSPSQILRILQGAMITQPESKLITAAMIEDCYRQQCYQQDLLQQRSYQSVLAEQIYIATDGEEIGQINGLSVIEYPGVPYAFGEPSRISCLVQIGEGEIVDVDRKNELAGNIHSKGMMIAQSCLSNILQLPSQLPFSASLVFEQSYTEIDGDSASLAMLCVLVSALAELPLPQNIAITGAIDQFGLVHAVGGVNEKIEGFFAICQQRGLTGKQGVIIPTVVCAQLSLNQAVIEAVKAGTFHLWIVEDATQALQILLQRDLVEMPDTEYHEANRPLNQLIMQNIEQKAEAKPLLNRWFPWLNSHKK